MNLLIQDGGRRKQNTGYGALSRGIIRSLLLYANNLNIFLLDSNNPWEKDINKEEIESVKHINAIKDIDCILSICNPENFMSHKAIPNFIYTQNALGDIPAHWIENLQAAKEIIVPGNFDKNIFNRYFNNVSTCPQYVDESIYKPTERWRNEGSNAFTFLFIGSFSFRKGADLLLEVFNESPWPSEQKIKLILLCSAGFSDSAINFIISRSKMMRANLEIEVITKPMSAPWINRIINRCDCVVTLSRGEGWCMPLYEGLLCGKPVIAPNSTAMGEFLPSSGVRLIGVRPMPVSELNSEFSRGFRDFYTTDSNVYYEPDFEDAKLAFREMVDNYNAYKDAAMIGREYILKKYSLKVMGERLNFIISKGFR